MKISFNHLLNKAKTGLNQAFDHAKETLYSITSTPSATVQQIADYVRNHPDTKITRKVYLDVVISFYELSKGEMRYYLETNNRKILQLDVHSHHHSVVAYRSYRDHLSVNTPVKFPDIQDAQ